MMNNTISPKLNKRLFWDVDFEAIDFHEKMSFVIERVFNRGDVEDIRHCRRFYGDEKIEQVLTNAKYIVPHRIHLISAILDQPLTAFKCYTTLQSRPTPYLY